MQEFIEELKDGFQATIDTIKEITIFDIIKMICFGILMHIMAIIVLI